jgi:hypothetical protein
MTTLNRRLERLEQCQGAGGNGRPMMQTDADWLACFEEHGRLGFCKDAAYAAALAAYRDAADPYQKYALWGPLAEHFERLGSTPEGEKVLAKAEQRRWWAR